MAQKALTVSGIAGTDRTYNATTADALSGTAALSGKVSGDSLTLNGPGVGTLDSPNAGTEAVTISGYSVSSGNANNDAANYAFSQPAVANVTIAQEALTLTATDQSKTYGFGGTSAALGTTGFTDASGTIYGTDITGVSSPPTTPPRPRATIKPAPTISPRRPPPVPAPPTTTSPTPQTPTVSAWRRRR